MIGCAREALTGMDMLDDSEGHPPTTDEDVPRPLNFRLLIAHRQGLWRAQCPCSCFKTGSQWNMPGFFGCPRSKDEQAGRRDKRGSGQDFALPLDHLAGQSLL